MWFFQAANVKAAYIPYSTGGTAQSTIDTVAGRADATIVTYLTAKPFLTTGKLRALATTGEKRSPVMPDVPTMAESGVPGYAAGSWYGYMAPVKTPPAILKKLADEIVAVSSTKDFGDQLMNWLPPAEVARLI